VGPRNHTIGVIFAVICLCLGACLTPGEWCAAAAPGDAGREQESHGLAGRVVQTVGLLDKTGESIKQGFNKVGQSLTPTPQTTSANDPTSLSSKPRQTPELYLSMAQFHEGAGKVALAEQAYQQALQLAPRHLGAHLAYARFKDRQGQTDPAFQIYKKAAQLYPNEAAVYNDLGLFYARHGSNQEALSAYGRAIELQPNRALYRNNVAVLLVDVGRSEQALGHLMAVYPEAEACYKVGYLLQKKGQSPQAMDYFAKATALNPSMREARVWLDHLARQSGQTPQIARRIPEVAQPPIPAQAGPGVEPQQAPPGSWVPAQRRPSEVTPPAVRPFPAVPRTLPDGSPGESVAPGAAPRPAVRPLPPTSAERPIAYEEESDVAAPQAAVPATPAPESSPSATDLEEAPLPTAVPRPLKPSEPID